MTYLQDQVYQREGELRYYAHKNDFVDTESFIFSCKQDPNLALSILRSAELDNEEKINIVLNSVLKKGNIGLVIGRKGSGKSVFLYWVMKTLNQLNINRPVQIYKEFKKYNMAENIYSLKQIKQFSVLLIDELGIKFPARDSASESNKLLQKLLVLIRHKDMSVISTVQNSKLGDINVYRLSDYMIYNELSPKQIETERENSLSELDLFFVNMLDMNNSPSLTYFTNGTYSFLFEMPFFEDYDSKQYENIDFSNEEKEVYEFIEGSKIEGNSLFQIYQDLALYGLEVKYKSTKPKTLTLPNGDEVYE